MGRRTQSSRSGFDSSRCDSCFDSGGARFLIALGFWRQSSLFAFMFLALSATGLSGCAKKKDQVSLVDSEAYVKKSDFTGKTFHLVRAIEDVDSENDVDLVPGLKESFGLVETRITENELQFISAYHPRGRPATMTIVASYPISDHFDIEREENDFKEKTHRTVEDRRKPWHERAYMRVNWAWPSNTMSSFSARLGEADVNEENTVLVTPPSFENGTLHWRVETSLKSSVLMRLAGEEQGVLDVPAYRAIYSTYLMPTVESGFEPASYDLRDFSRFGFFYTQQNFEDPEKGLRDSLVKRSANIFNVCEAGRKDPCAKNRITWYLSESFPDRYISAARAAVEEWNRAFQHALNRKDDVVFLDLRRRRGASDPRFNVIAHYEPKTVRRSLLGLTNAVSDPRSGETVSANVVIYESGVRHALSEADLMIDLLNSDDPLKDVLKASVAPLRSGLLGVSYRPRRKSGDDDDRASITASLAGSLDEPQAAGSLQTGVPRSSRPEISAGASTDLERLRASLARARREMSSDPARAQPRRARAAEALKDIFLSRESLLLLGRAEGNFDLRSSTGPGKQDAGPFFSDGPRLNGFERVLFPGQWRQQRRMRDLREARQGLHGADMVEDATRNYLLKMLQTDDVKDLRMKRVEIKENLAEKIVFSTLLHELGHAFGLRHNFAASADRRNYQHLYHALTDLSPEDRDPFAYSSVMDYGAEFYVGEAGLGPYDRASIRYVYNRGIDREKDPVTKAGFLFCTDHQVGEEIHCRKFDKGSNVSEITAHVIERYERNWALDHFRRDRLDFDRIGARIPERLLFETMLPVRQVMDELGLAFLGPDDVPSARQKGGLCNKSFVRDSVASGEIGDICAEDEARSLGVDPANPETYFAALFKDGGNELRVPSKNLRAYGLADLLYANLLARDFFLQVLGTADAGAYVALKDSDDETGLESKGALAAPETESAPYVLHALDGAVIGYEERLHAFEGERIPGAALGAEGFTQGVLKSIDDMVVELTVTPDVRPYRTRISEAAGLSRLESVGSFWDKAAALRALSSRDIKTKAYTATGLYPGNVFVFPHSRGLADLLFTRMMSGQGFERLTTVRLKNGRLVRARLRSASDSDLRNLAVYMVFEDSLSDGSSMARRIRVSVCGARGGDCRNNSLGRPSVEYVSADGENVYRAVQTGDHDSLAYGLVAKAKEIDDERQRWISLMEKAKQASPRDEQKVAFASRQIERLTRELEGREEPILLLRRMMNTEGTW